MEVFDDRLEITSPGGMMNGRRVQDMDIRHIPSMRRNQVISDVFSRLGFMECRGSGIDRILNSYVEVAQKPTFYSDSDFFIVTLPNRSVATPAQISMESVASGAESAETSAESAETSTVLHGMSTDAEVSELCERLNALSYKCDSFLAGSTSPFGHTAASCITLSFRMTIIHRYPVSQLPI